MEITKTDKNNFFIVTKSINAALEHMAPKADVVMFSAPQKDKVNKVDGVVVFDSAGEYEVKNCMIDAISLGLGITSYSILSEGIRLAYLPSADDVLTDAQIEAFASVDILLIPVAGEKASGTIKIIGQIEPKVIVPHSYSPEELKMLTDELGREQEKTAKLKIAKKELTETEQQRLVVIE